MREQVAPYLIRTEKRDAVDNNGNPLFKKRHTQVMEISWLARHELQRQLYESVTEYVRNGYNKAVKERKNYIGFLMILFQRMVSSSTDAIIDATERRLQVLQHQSDQLHSGSFEELVEGDTEDSLRNALLLYSANIKEEIKQLSAILSLAKRASLACRDAKQEALVDLLEKIERNEPGAKIILFTEFVATQESLRQLMEYNGITTTLINGSMSLDERNASLQRFRTEKQMLISTDAGGEGLNLQCSHIVINYDLPWNPMKIEQRIGRADRIGQTDDVQVFNFILKSTIENRVRAVLMEKMDVILEELGIDKLQDVLDEGNADMDFTRVYIDSIADPRSKDLNVSIIERTAQKQVDQFKRIQSVIHEEKKFTRDEEYERQQHSFHMLLKEMLYQYRRWQGDEPEWRLDWELSLSDKQVRDILSRKQIWHQSQGLQEIHFDNLKAENGVFSLWEVSLGEDPADKQIIPVFINDQGMYRPAASRLIWEELLKPDSKLSVVGVSPAPADFWTELETHAQEIATDVFLQMQDAYQQRHEQNYKKRQRALSLRLEAAQKIGIENIRTARISRLEAECRKAAEDYERHQEMCPTFSPVVACLTR